MKKQNIVQVGCSIPLCLHRVTDLVALMHGIVSASVDSFCRLFAIVDKTLSARPHTPSLHSSGSYHRSYWTCLIPTNLCNLVFYAQFHGKSIIHDNTRRLGISEIVSKIYDEKQLFGEIRSVMTEGFSMPSTHFYLCGDNKEQLIEQMCKSM